MSGRWAGLLLAAAATVGLAGCDRDDAPAAGGGGTTTSSPAIKINGGVPATASTTTTTSPSTTRAAESMMTIDGTMVLFPAARLRVDEADGKVFARLFSDDPKGAALDPKYVGNSFYLQLEMDGEEAKDVKGAADLNGVELKYQSPTRERDDTHYGIFLEGRRWVLQPADVTVTFAGAASPLDVQLSGKFLLFDSNDETVKPRTAEVTAKLSAAMQAKK
jgi:hypothetical protein